MKPTIQLHGVIGLRLTEPRVFTKEERTDGGEAFASRQLIVTDEKGDQFTVSIFGPNATGITLTSELDKRRIRKDDGTRPPIRSCEFCPADGGGCNVCSPKTPAYATS